MVRLNEGTLQHRWWMCCKDEGNRDEIGHDTVAIQVCWSLGSAESSSKP